MDNHPIPQDITGFQFKLIGDMTIKQFAYLATGVIFGWITFSLPGVYIIIKFPLALLIVGFGASLAFLPIEGRPMDTMIVNFFKAVFSPTQFIYVKTEDNIITTNNQGNVADTSQKQLQNFINALPAKKNKLDEKETVFFQNLASYSTAPQAQQTLPQPVSPHAFADKTPTEPQQHPIPQSPEEIKGEESLKDQMQEDQNLKNEAAILEKELKEAKEKESMQDKVDSKEYLEAHQKVLELQKSLNDAAMQKQELEKKLVELQQQIVAKQQGQVFSPSVAKAEPQTETKFVRSIPQSMAKGVGLPITPDFPNVITGIVKDPRGNPLPNILVEVKDAEGNAVRAFKTNALGQFASATPLINGKYTMSFEDPKSLNKFDMIGFEARGQIILPVEVISIDTREELRRSLFN